MISLKRTNLAMAVSASLLAVITVIAVSKGAVEIHLLGMTEVQRDILLYVRIPRVLLAGLVGASLVLSGTLFQYVMKNPLADSFTTGVSASSAMGAVVAIMLGLGPVLPVFALAGGLTGLAAVYKISSVRGRVQPITMLLAGIVISTFASATISLMKFLSDDAVSSIIFWLMGGFQSASMGKVATLAGVLAASFAVIRRDYLSLDIICFDDTTASSSGVDVARLRRKAFFIAALLTAFSVGYAGIIGFVGLVVPHVVRLLRYVKAAELIPLSLLCGALFMILNDLVARTVLSEGQELPVGIITSSIGGVFFLYLLIKRKKELYYFD
ncbi:MAG TPA: iron ABC transporter permease [Nitrospirae bacterium]|nr:iron ABC transporter permease [Nitrospirota bacterium]